MPLPQPKEAGTACTYPSSVALLCGATPNVVLKAIETATIPTGMLTLQAGLGALADELKAMGRTVSDAPMLTDSANIGDCGVH